MLGPAGFQGEGMDFGVGNPDASIQGYGLEAVHQDAAHDVMADAFQPLLELRKSTRILHHGIRPVGQEGDDAGSVHPLGPVRQTRLPGLPIQERMIPYEQWTIHTLAIISVNVVIIMRIN